MVQYSELRPLIKDGDVFLCEGRGWVSRIIRALTGQSHSHVAMLLWFGKQLFVAEMKEFHGYRLMPASLWLEDNLKTAYVSYGRAPDSVRAHHGLVEVALGYRHARYGYLSLIGVWWAQIARKLFKHNGDRLVCSTFVQACWEATGYIFSQTADPGDYARYCDPTRPVGFDHA